MEIIETSIAMSEIVCVCVDYSIASILCKGIFLGTRRITILYYPYAKKKYETKRDWQLERWSVLKIRADNGKY